MFGRTGFSTDAFVPESATGDFLAYGRSKRDADLPRREVGVILSGDPFSRLTGAAT